ncbi:MAG TPA: type II secretion system F family protein [Gaiellaceae bacterium]|nr:type II secretion system F family protein [Gaiellaceae bacterium]
MTRKALAVGILLGALGLLAAFAAGASGATQTRGLRVIEAGQVRFPDRAFVLTLPTRRRLGAGAVHVLENGGPVSSVSIVPAGAAERGDFGVVLVIDTSNSMRGSAIVDAMRAARAFAARRSPNQQLAVVTFNREASVLLPFTSDGATVHAALASRPPLAQGTHVYDGVATALELLRTAKISSGSIVVLSDGADTGSRVSAASAAASAREGHVRIFSVGIRSSSFLEAPLKSLAHAARGDYSGTSSTADLARIYGQLGVRLAGEYLLRYRSRAEPNAKIRVQIRVDGIAGEAASGYVTPALPPISASEPYHRSLAGSIWQSALTMLLVSLLSAGLFAMGVVAIVRPRRGNLRARMAHFVSLRVAGKDSDNARLTERVLVGAERSLETTKWWARFVETLELAQIRIPAVHLLLWTFVATFFAMWFLALLGGSLLFGVLGLGLPFAVRGAISRRVARQRARFAEELPDNLQVLASALRAGHSLVGALSVVVEEAAEPSRSEFRRVVADEQLGVPLDEALNVVVRRMDNRDLQQVGLVAALQRQTGGNMAEVLDRVTETIRERFELRRMVQTLTAQGRMSRWVVSLLPVALLAAISLLNPTYVEPLFNEMFGRVLLAVAAVMLVVGSLVIKKIVDIKL